MVALNAHVAVFFQGTRHQGPHRGPGEGEASDSAAVAVVEADATPKINAESCLGGFPDRRGWAACGSQQHRPSNGEIVPPWTAQLLAVRQVS